jgi:hypothetical protein
MIRLLVSTLLAPSALALHGAPVRTGHDRIRPQRYARC